MTEERRKPTIAPHDGPPAETSAPPPLGSLSGSTDDADSPEIVVVF